MESLLFSLNIVLPMAILLAMGYIFKKIGFLSKEFIAAGKKFCFYCLLSCSLFKNLYDSSLDVFPLRLIIFVVTSILGEFVISFMVANVIADRKNEKGVIIQGTVRSNFAYIGIPLASMMFTQAELVAAVKSEVSILTIFVIPLFNVLSVIALSYYSDDDKGAKVIERTVKGIIRNPCIISITLGLMVLLFRMAVPTSSFFFKDKLSFIYKVIEYLSSMSTPFAFILVGADLDFTSSVSNFKKLFITVNMRILIYPVLVLLIAYLMGGFVNVDYAVLVSIFASPTAVASAIMAAELNGDKDLANELVVYTTIFSVISLIIIIFVLKTMGCL